MSGFQDIERPEDLDWRSWVERWDSMKSRDLVKRKERYEIIADLVEGTLREVENVVDLGCGTGSLMAAVLERIPDVRVVGIDFDPTMLFLAEARLMPFGNRAKIEYCDLRQPSWCAAIKEQANAVISATALHWLNPPQLAELYGQIARILRKGGIFLNADHVASRYPAVQRVWEKNRKRMRREEPFTHSDDWNGFWKEYSEALGIDVEELHGKILGGWEGGVKEGLPLTWHFDVLREIGFSHVDCFWRNDCDAIYGGIMP